MRDHTAVFSPRSAKFSPCEPDCSKAGRERPQCGRILVFPLATTPSNHNEDCNIAMSNRYRQVDPLSLVET